MQQTNIINSCVKIESLKNQCKRKEKKEQTTDRNNKTKSKAVI